MNQDPVILLVALLCAACSDGSGRGSDEVGGSSSAGTGGAEGGTRGGVAGANTGGASAPSGGANTGGASVPSGGANTGGASAPSGGSSTGGAGAPSGGANTGGVVVVSGGTTTGGTPIVTGGAGTGGASADGGSGTGGTAGSPGGSGPLGCRPECGTHKWPCWPMPNPVGSPAGVPNQQSYEDLGNGAIRDNVTCLVWEKSNPGNVGNWQANNDRCAQLAADGFAGYDDWRLPTRVEMASITDVTLGSTGYPSVFDVTGGYYVTGSDWYKTILTEGSENRVWGYGTNGFTSNAIVKSDTDLVARCVRSDGRGEAADEYAVEPPDHYAIDAETARDNYTGLRWQRGYSPALMSWSDAPAYCESLSLDGHGGFRVPTINELATTVDEAQVGGAINGAVFPDNPEGCREPQYWFWAAESSRVGGEGWGLSYCDGFTGWNAGETGDWNYFPEANVRCVSSE